MELDSELENLQEFTVIHKMFKIFLLQILKLITD